MTIKSIPWEQLCICFHSDAAFGNAKEHKTQAGYILAFAHQQLEQSQPSMWSPLCWKSYKLPRVVASTLGAESQAYATASAVAEWTALLVAEAKRGGFDLRSSEQVKDTPALQYKVMGQRLIDQISKIPIIGVTDCKSLYDHLHSMSSVSTCEDRRVAIDLAILRSDTSHASRLFNKGPRRSLRFDSRRSSCGIVSAEPRGCGS